MRTMLTCVALTVILAVCSGRCAAQAEDVVAATRPQAAFKMRPDLKGVHPRLYFTKADIPRIQGLGKGPGKFFLERAMHAYRGYLGKDVPETFEPKESWKQYLYGFWGLFSFDMAYVVEGDERCRDTAKKWALQLTERTWWMKDDIAPMDTLSGLALTYDILYDEFSEAERKKIRRSIYDGAEFIRQRFFVGQYWTHDCQNNHMHNRIHGLAHAAFAIYGDDPELDVQPHADLAIGMIDAVVRWLPEDGSQHEGPGYWSFGHHWAARAVKLAEHVTGRHIISLNPHFTTAHLYRLYMTAPGWRHTLNIGDGEAGGVGDPTIFALLAAEARDGHAATILERLMKEQADSFYNHPAWGLLWFDPTLQAKPLADMPLWRFWPDLEMFSIRRSWDDDATAFVFKCGPVGGHKMQRLRGKEEQWVNVAHDHPDQNHFLLFAHGKMLAEDDGYPKDKKLTRSHNTIVIDGKGQPREGTGWQQPFPYNQTGYLDDVFLSHNTAYACGNAHRCYEGAEEYVRHVAFVAGEYVICLDELVGAGDGEHEFQWRLHKKGDWKKLADDHFTVADGDVSLDVRFLVPEAGQMTDSFLPAELTAQPCLAVTRKAKAAKFLAVLVPQKSGSPKPAAERIGDGDCIGVRVSIGGKEDLFLVAGQSCKLAAPDVSGTGMSVLVRHGGDALESFMLTRGEVLTVKGRQLVKAPDWVNLSWRKAGNAVVVETEAPYRARGRPMTIAVGGFESGKSYSVTVDGEAQDAAKADDAGLLHMGVDLSSRRTIRFAPAD